MTTSPVQLDRLQVGIIAWLRQTLPAATVVWGPSELPRGAAGYLLVAARLLTGPSDAPLGGAATPTVTLPTVLRWTVDPTAGPGDTVGLDVSGWRYEYVLEAGEDAADARAAVLALMVPTGGPQLVAATFTSQGAASIDVAALEVGDLYQPRALGASSLTILDSEVAIAQLSTAESLIELDFRASVRFPFGGAAAACARVQATLALPSAADLLERHGLGVSVDGSPAQIDALAGPVWESRSVLTIRVSQVQLAAEAVGLIDRVYATLEARSIDADEPTITASIDTGPP